MKKGVMKEMTAVLGAVLLFAGVSATEVRAEDDNSLKVNGFVDGIVTTSVCVHQPYLIYRSSSISMLWILAIVKR